MTNNLNNMKELFDSLLSQIDKLVGTSMPTSEKLQAVCDVLHDNVIHYDWVGFYIVDKNNKRELVLGPFAGAPTEHVRIPFGKGICGQAAETREVFVVPDVAKETNYLACSLNVKSEIVVPILNSGELVGELDIDSHKPEAFATEDTEFLRKVVDIVGRLI